jgi:phosphoglycerate dehydrogenase-like enzyme
MAARSRRLRVVLAEDGDLAGAIRAGIPDADVVLAAGEALRGALGDADALVCWRLSREDTADAGRLRFVQATSAGVDRIDRSALPPGCTLCNVRGHEDAMAEWVVLGMLALTRRLLLYDRDLRRGEWHRHSNRLPPAQELAGRTLGTIGYGPIGRRVGELGRALGMDTVAVTRDPKRRRASARALGWLGGLHDLDRLLTEADFAVVCLPRTPETAGLVGRRELELLGRGGYLVNVGRGEVVEEQALYEALRDGNLAGAAIDVWYRYPGAEDGPAEPSAYPFHELDNVVMSPHVSAHSDRAEARRRAFVVEQLARFADGRPLQNVLAKGSPAPG